MDPVEVPRDDAAYALSAPASWSKKLPDGFAAVVPAAVALVAAPVPAAASVLAVAEDAAGGLPCPW